MRIVVEQLGQLWGQQTVLVNQPGAGGALAARAALTAPPDGRTLHMAIASTFTLLPSFSPRTPSMLMPSCRSLSSAKCRWLLRSARISRSQTLADLVAQSKQKPDGLSLATDERRNSACHRRTVSGALRGEADLCVLPGKRGRHERCAERPGAGDRRRTRRAGRQGQLKILAVAASQRVKTHPDIPTVTESYPGVIGTGWFALVAPPGTPDEIVRKINSDIVLVLSKPDVRQKLDAMTITTRAMSPPSCQPSSAANASFGSRSLRTSAQSQPR